MKTIFTRSLFYSSVLFLFCLCYSNYSKGQLVEKAPSTNENILYDSISVSKDGHKLGYIPPKFFMNHLVSMVKQKSSTILPTYYDSREENLVTAVKDQGNCGSCWVFSTMGCVESNLLMQGYCFNNLSEQHLNTCGLGEFCEGGNSYYSIAYFTCGIGPSTEQKIPYDENNSQCIKEDTVCFNVLNAYFLPNDKELIKETILNYGAVATNFYWDSYYYKSTDYTYYCNESDLGTNHGVTIVGWDDEIETEGGTGAWIIKNSWGASWGDQGYFYMSYNNQSAHTLMVYYPDITYNIVNYKSDGYNENGLTGSIGFRKSKAYGLIKFVPLYDLYLEKVGTWIVSDDAKISIKIYNDFDGKNLSNLLGEVATEEVPYSGFRTFTLDEKIPRTANDDYYILICYETPEYNYPVPYDDESTITQDVAWISYSGTSSWSSMDDYGNISMRVFTTQAPTSLPEAEIVVSTDTTTECGLSQYSNIVLKTKTDNPGATVTWSISPSDYEYICGYTQNSNPAKVTFSSSGEYSISLKVENQLGVDSTTLDTPIKVIDSYLVPFADDFNNNEFNSYGWGTDNYENEVEWEKLDDVKGMDQQNGVMAIDYYSNYDKGQSHNLTLPPISFEDLSSAQMKFNVAYRYCCTDYNDRLEVWVSTNCGYNFSELVYEKFGEELSTIFANSSNYLTRYEPDSKDDWRIDSVDLSDYIGRDVIIQFRSTCSGYYANMIYLDDVVVSGKYLINGKTNYYNSGEPISDVLVSLKANRAVTTKEDKSLTNGAFSFDEITNNEYVLTATLDADAVCISATDALLVELSAIDVAKLDSFQTVAADVDKSGTISATDALLIKKYTVGIIDQFPAGSWFFRPKEVVVDNGSVEQNITGIYYGDVNCSYNAPTLKSSLMVNYSDSIAFYADSIYTIPVSITAKNNIGAVTTAVSYPDELMELIEVTSNQGNLQYADNNNVAKIAWTNNNTYASDLTFYLTVKLKEPNAKEILLNIDPQSEFADVLGKNLDEVNATIPIISSNLNISGINNLKDNPEEQLMCYPNPCRNKCTLKYSVPSAGHVCLNIFNNSGRKVKTILKANQPKGVYNLQLILNEFDNGIYHIQLEINTPVYNINKYKKIEIIKN